MILNLFFDLELRQTVVGKHKAVGPLPLYVESLSINIQNLRNLLLCVCKDYIELKKTDCVQRFKNISKAEKKYDYAKVSW